MHNHSKMTAHNLAVILFQPEIPPNTGNILFVIENWTYDKVNVYNIGYE